MKKLLPIVLGCLFLVGVVPPLYRNILETRAKRLYAFVEAQVLEVEQCYLKFRDLEELSDNCLLLIGRSKKDLSYPHLREQLKDPVFFWMRQLSYLEMIRKKYASTSYLLNAYLWTSYLHCKSAVYGLNRQENIEHAVLFFDLASGKKNETLPFREAERCLTENAHLISQKTE